MAVEVVLTGPNGSREPPAQKTDGPPGELRGNHTTAPSDPLIGKVIDNRYRILSLVAQGGMGRVYQAEQAPLGRVVALKVLDSGKTPETDKEMRQRFILEAAACARLNHPNTVRIFDYGKTWDDVLYISMEYINGRTLHHVIKQEAPLPLDRVIRILRQMCSSLREAHAAGLIHRDLKPSNVMLTRHGDEIDFVKVLDFGLVRQVMGDSELTQVDAVVGSPSYMSPEQIRGERLDQRSDIYSLGVLMYTCIVGKTPFAGESPVKVMMAHLNSAPPPMAPVCPALTEVPMLEWVVRTCLEKEPQRRFASVEELMKAMRVAERQLRGEHPPAPILENGKLMISEEWTSSSSMAPMNPHSGSISRSSLPVPPPSESSVSSVANRKKDRSLPLLAVATLLLGAFVGMLLLVGLWLLLRPGHQPAAWAPPAEAPASVGAAPAPPGLGTVPSPQPAAPAASSEPVRTEPVKAPAKASTEPKAAPRTEPAAAPKAEPKTEPKGEPKTEPKGEVKTEPKVEPTTAPKTEPTPEPTPKKAGSDLKDPWSQ